MKDNTNYNVDYFIKKFESIPEERFLTRQFADNENNGCANGLAYIDNIGLCEFTALFNEYAMLFTPLYMGNGTFTQQVNNGDDPKYKQSTPKQRILAALYDIKAMQQPKERFRYVVVAEELKNLPQVAETIDQ